MSTYTALLQRPEWKAKRWQLLAKAGFQCQRICWSGDRCETMGENLEVHHIRYISGRLPWQYPDSMLRVLCRDCHEIEQHETDKARVMEKRERFKRETDPVTWDLLTALAEQWEPYAR